MITSSILDIFRVFYPLIKLEKESKSRAYKVLCGDPERKIPRLYNASQGVSQSR